MAEKKQIDWDVVGRDVSAGLMTYDEIAAKYGCSKALVVRKKHLHGWSRREIGKSGCAIRPDHMKAAERGFVYVICANVGGIARFKIGKSSDPFNRIGNIQVGCPVDISVVAIYFSVDARREERELHAMFSSKRVRGEWFDLSPSDLEEIALRSFRLGGVFDG